MCVRKRTEGWVVDFHHRAPDGRRKRVRKLSPVQTKRGAERYERELRRKILDGVYDPFSPNPESRVPTLAEWSVEFMEGYAKAHNRPAERKKKESVLRVHLLPFFGRVPLDQISKPDIKRYQSRKLKTGLNPKTINNHTGILGKIMAEAVEHELIDIVPRVKALPETPPKEKYLSFEDADRLIAGAEEGQWRNMITLALKTGLRQGELLGLQWQDVDIHERILHVRRNYHRGMVTPPKTNRNRSLPLCDNAVEALQRQHHRKGDWVFCDAEGEPLTDNACKSPIRRACKRAGIECITWHVLRHTFCSHLSMKGVGAKAIQQFLGHSTLNMTMRYSHLDTSYTLEQVQKLNSSGQYMVSENGTELKVFENTK